MPTTWQPSMGSPIYMRGLLGNVGGEIYDHLLGNGTLLVVPNKQLYSQLNYNESKLQLPEGWPELKDNVYDPNNSNQNKKYVVVFINEVPGYGRANGKQLNNYIAQHFYGKEEMDAHLFHQLMMYFEKQHWSRIHKALNQSNWDQHTVFGLHIRAGNGETGQFAQKRTVQDLDQWLENTGQLFCDYSKEYSHLFQDYPLMIYLGTDTPSVIDKLQSILKNLTVSSNCTEIPLVTTEQERMEAGTGVTYQIPRGMGQEACYERWTSMFLDAYFISRSNTVVAGQFSSFTKAAPFTLVTNRAQFHKKNPDAPRPRPHPDYFCEVGATGKRLDCYDSYAGMFQKEAISTFGNTLEPIQVNGLKGAAYRIPRRQGLTATDMNKNFANSPLTFQDPSNRTR